MAKKEILKYVLSGLTVFGLILGGITDGFQVWDIFFSKDSKEISNTPSLIDFKVDPFMYDLEDSGVDYKKGRVKITIQSVNGTFKIIDNLRITKFNILQNDFFDFTFTPKIILKSFDIDRRILDSKVSDQIGYINFKNDFVLDGYAMSDVIRNNSEETIANFTILIPYVENGITKTHTCVVPIIVYYKS